MASTNRVWRSNMLSFSLRDKAPGSAADGDSMVASGIGRKCDGGLHISETIAFVEQLSQVEIKRRKHAKHGTDYLPTASAQTRPIWFIWKILLLLD